MSKEALALFVGNSTELLELIQYREDLALDPDMLPADLAESLKAIDARIEQYVRTEIQRVDGVAAYMRECESRVTALDAEKKRISERIALWKARQERVKEVVTRVMQALGARLLEGQNATLRLKKNPPSVEVSQPDLVPDKFKLTKVTMSQNLYDKLVAFLDKRYVMTHSDEPLAILAELLAAKKEAPEPSKSLLAAELKQSGSVPGAHLITDKVHLEVS